MLLGVASNQCITRGYIYSQIGTLFSWSGSSQSSWNGSNQVATVSDFTTFVQNNGACTGPSTTLITYGQATACATNSSAATHTPILANNSFAGGSFVSWSSANVGSCTGALFSSLNGGDEDGDGGFANASSLGCTTTAAQVTLVQSFSTGGAPTSQTYSFWYKGAQATSGDSSCTLQTGSASFVLKIGSTAIATVASPTLDGAWHQVTGTMSAMVSGSNTLTLTATLQGARGQYNRYNPKIQGYICTFAGTAIQQIQVDNFVLSGVW
jgi:hypothetical protein